MSELNVTKIENEADSSAVEVNRKATDGTIIDLQKDGTAVGSIGTYDTDIHIGSGDVGLSFYDVGDTVLPFDPSTPVYRDNAIDLGNSSNRFKNLYLSGGVSFDAGSHFLDDYEEGDWTATFAGSATTATGKYVKTGALVHIQVFATLNVTSSVTAIISGLPFPVITYSVGTAAHNNYTSNADQGYFTSGGTSFTFMTNSSVNVASTVTGNPKYTMVAGTYYTTS